MLKNIQSATFDKAYEQHQEWIKQSMAPGNVPGGFSKEEEKEHNKMEGLRGNLKNMNLFLKDSSRKDLFFNKDFRYFDFSGSCFCSTSSIRSGTTTEFENSVFIGCNFSGCDLSHVTAQKCTFSGCDFRKANLNNTIFRKSKLRNCNFQRAKMLNTEMSDCDLFGSDMSICKIKNCRIFNCIATGVSFVNTVLTDCNLRLLRFKNIHMTNCIVQNCDVKYSDLQNVYNGDKK